MQGEGCSLGGLLGGGHLVPGGVCLLRRVPGPGRGAWSLGGGIPACTEADPPTENITLPQTSFAGSKYRYLYLSESGRNFSP